MTPVVPQPGSDSTAAAHCQTPKPAAAAGRGRRVVRWVGRVLCGLAAVAALAGAAWAYHLQQEKKANAAAAAKAGPKAPRVERLSDDTLGVPPAVAASLGIKTAAATPADRPRPLPPLQGTLAFENSRLTRIYSPFPGLVVALGTVEKGETEQPFAGTGPRVLEPGDRVEADQLLAVVWSSTLGEKKSELVDAVSALKLNEDTLNRLKSLTDGIVERKRITEAETAVRTSENAISKAMDTLRAWRLPEKEIQAIKAEAERLTSGAARRELTSGKTWARVEIRAPFAGILIEKNTNVRNVVDTNTALFQVADLTRLMLLAQVFEEDLPALQKLPRPIPWEIRLPSQPGFRAAGTLDRFNPIIDTTQHTALAIGTVENPNLELKVGQGVTATVAVPPAPGEVEIPTSALIEDGKSSVVFVQPDPKVPQYVRRPVTVTRRQHDVVYVAGSAVGGVRPGEQVVVGGALQLNQVLTDAGTAVAANK
jgi:cobalt-zinc-cadmium efflux system membrane fusion protein